MNFESLGLSMPILRALTACHYTSPTPIQTQAIPPALAGRDVLGSAQTGTGKTCAFGTPLLQRLAEKPQNHKQVRALILTPTRELALQIDENLTAYRKHLPLKNTVIFGGVGQEPQVQRLKQGVDVLTATPGRLLDLCQQKLLSLKQVEILVLDEADRMLDMGFIHDVRRILALLPQQKQTLFFSATMPPELHELVDSLLQNPVKVAVDPVSSPVERIDQSLYFVDRRNKTALLCDLLQEKQVKSALVFTRTKHGADKVSRDLVKAGIASAAIHGNKSQTARQNALREFKQGKLQVLVATDIAARGIDIDELSFVVNYNLPDVPETYVHRIGRTGRAGHGGTAVSFCDHAEKPLLLAIEKLLVNAIPCIQQHPYPMQDFEAPKRDAKGRIVNADDDEARQMAREKRAERQKQRQPKVKAVLSETSEAPRTPPAKTSKRRPQGHPDAPLPAHPQESPHEFSRKNPLEGEVIMDATARMFASRSAKLPKQPFGKRKHAQTDSTSERFQSKTAQAPKPENRKQKRKGSASQTVANIAEKVLGKNHKAPTPQPQKDKNNSHRNYARRIPRVEAPHSHQKDSTEQASLMKPFYIEHD